MHRVAGEAGHSGLKGLGTFCATENVSGSASVDISDRSTMAVIEGLASAGLPAEGRVTRMLS